MKTSRFTALAAALVSISSIVFASATAANPVQIDFSGSFYSNNSSTVLGLPLAGQSFTGILTYDDSPNLAQPVGSTFQDQSFQAPYALAIKVGYNTISSNGYRVSEIVGSQLRIDAGAGSAAPSTTLSVNGIPSIDPTSGLYFAFFADTNNPLTTLPVVPASFTDPVYGYIYGPVNSNELGFTITTFAVAPVPIPATAWFFGSGVLGLIGASRRRA